MPLVSVVQTCSGMRVCDPDDFITRTDETNLGDTEIVGKVYAAKYYITKNILKKIVPTNLKENRENTLNKIKDGVKKRKKCKLFLNNGKGF